MTQTDGIFDEVVVARHLSFIDWLQERPGTCMSLVINKHQVITLIISLENKEVHLSQKDGTERCRLFDTYYYRLLMQTQFITAHSELQQVLFLAPSVCFFVCV